MSEYSITDLKVPSAGFDRDNPGESNVKRYSPHILTEQEEEQAERTRIARAATHKRDQETYAAMIAHEPAKRRA